MLCAKSAADGDIHAKGSVFGAESPDACHGTDGTLPQTHTIRASKISATVAAHNCACVSFEEPEEVRAS